MDRWVGATAVVTGASAGIGAATCVALANAGFNVVGLARRKQRVDDLKSEIRGKGTIQSRQCDISDPSQVKAVFKWVDEHLGGTHVLVNNAGVAVPGHITDVSGPCLSDTDVINTIDLNLKGLILCARYAISSMTTQGFNGHVINISSIAGHYIPFSETFNVYPSTKWGVTAFSSTLANELAQLKSKIKVTNLSPGLVKTEMTSDAMFDTDFPALLPKDVADSILYVLSTPPNVNISELTIQPVSEKRL